MVVFPVPPEVESSAAETDPSVLEAERELTQYFQTLAPKGPYIVKNMELGPKNHNLNGFFFLGSHSIMVVYMDPLGLARFRDTHRPLSSSCLWFIFSILQGNPQKGTT